MASDIPCESLTELLEVHEAKGGRFAAALGDFWGDSMDSDAIARAALAGARSQPELELLSFQGHVTPGLSLATPLELRVEATEPGDGVARQRVELWQDGPRGAFDACLAIGGTGPTHQDVPLPPDLPAPDEVPSTVACARAEGWPEEYARGPLEFRRLGSLVRDPARGDDLAHQCWLLPRAPLPDDAPLQTAALVFAAHFYPHWEFERRLGPKFAHGRFQLLERSLHLHGRVRWDDWWLLDARAEIARDGRALSTRRLFDRSGRLLATATSHALVALL
jgi:acyl-CoA thioesterase-2